MADSPGTGDVMRMSRFTESQIIAILKEGEAGVATGANSSRYVSFSLPNLDPNMEFVWTLKHMDKTNWPRSSSVQIKPLQSIVLSCEQVPCTLQPSEFVEEFV